MKAYQRKEDGGVSTDPRVYWATQTEPREITSAVRNMFSAYCSRLRQLNWLSRTMRSWKYAHGIYFGDVNEQEAAIKELGPQGEVSAIAINDFRSLLLQLRSMVTKNRPQVTAYARDTDASTLALARSAKHLTKEILRQAEPFYDRAVLQALLFNVGYILTEWDPSLGESIQGDDGMPKKPGGNSYSNPSIFDLAFPWWEQTFEKWQWAIVRERTNRFDLIAMHPELEEELSGSDMQREQVADDIRFHISLDDETSYDDQVDTYKLFHRSTPAVPGGRFLRIFSEFVLEDGPLPYSGIPLARVSAGELEGTCFGYSPALDMQGPQEALNAEASTIGTTHKTTGLPRFWSKAGDVPMSTQIGDLTILESQTKPEELGLAKPTADYQNAKQGWRSDLQLMSGVNDVHRGAPQGQLKSGSGSAFAFLDAKALEANSSFMKSGHRALEALARFSLENLDRFTAIPYYMGLESALGRQQQILIQRGGLSKISRIAIEAGNPLLDSTSGKFEVGSLLLQQKAVTPEELLTFLQSGTYDTMLEAANAQLTRMREENEMLIAGELPDPDIADNHVLHMQEHQAAISTKEAQQDQGLVARVKAHTLSHLQMLSQPGTQLLMSMLGYANPLMGAPPNPAGGGEPPGGEGKKMSNNGSNPGGSGEPGMPKPPEAETASGTKSGGPQVP